MISSNDNTCFSCGKAGHYIESCPNKANESKHPNERFNQINDSKNNCGYNDDNNDSDDNDSDDSDSDDYDDYSNDDNHENKNDYRYQYQKYNAIKYTQSDVCFECLYCGKTFDTYNGALFHQNVYCKKKTSNQEIKSNTQKTTFISEAICYRCGRKNHMSNNCYALTHVKGYEL